jgi:hypothetical protein
MDHSAISQDRYGFTLAHDRGFAQIYAVISFRYIAAIMLRPWFNRAIIIASKRSVINALGLEKDNRIIVFNRGYQ